MPNMGRTYTQFVVAESRESLLSPQALIMAQFLLNGKVHSVTELVESLDIDNCTISTYCSILRKKKYLERQTRGMYRLTPLGRKVWEPILDVTFADASAA